MEARSTVIDVTNEAILTATEPHSYAELGWEGVLTPEVAFVGAPSPIGAREGEVHPFVRHGPDFTAAPPLHAPEPFIDDLFGRAIAASGDTLVVGAPNVNAKAGILAEFERQGDEWTFVDTLAVSNLPPGAEIGRHLWWDGDFLFASVQKDLVNGAIVSSLRTFRRVGASWSEGPILTDPEPSDHETNYGGTYARLGDFHFIGATQAGQAPLNKGRVYVYQGDEPPWSYVGAIEAPDDFDGAFFPLQLATSEDTLFAGAGRATVNGLVDAGAVFTFQQKGGSFQEAQKITSPFPTQEGRFGDDLAVSGRLLFVGAPTEDPGAQNIGRLYVFRQVGGDWLHRAAVIPEGAGPSAGVGLGLSVLGDEILVGAPGYDDPSTKCGAAFVLRIGAGLAETCEVGADCDSGHCVSGVCCDTPCAQSGYSCLGAVNGTGEDGTCQPILLPDGGSAGGGGEGGSTTSSGTAGVGGLGGGATSTTGAAASSGEGRARTRSYYSCALHGEDPCASPSRSWEPARALVGWLALSILLTTARRRKGRQVSR